MDSDDRRGIVREPEFEEQLRALVADFEEADDFTLGAEFVLSENPESGLPVSREGNIWYLPMGLIRGQRIPLFYTFDEHMVYLLWIQAFDD